VLVPTSVNNSDRREESGEEEGTPTPDASPLWLAQHDISRVSNKINLTQ